jgi:pimeloyl-ACP methyl ester carboxylesterase
VQVHSLVKEHEDEFQICIFDNRGCGRSSCPESKFSTSVMAKDTLDLLDHLEWEKVHVVGISMGGMISQELALLMLPQERLASLSLAVTHSGTFYYSLLFLIIIPHYSLLLFIISYLFMNKLPLVGGLYAMAPMAGIVGMMGSIFKKTPEEKAEPRTSASCIHSPIHYLY